MPCLWRDRREHWRSSPSRRWRAAGAAASAQAAELERRSAAKAKKAAEPDVPMVTSACHFRLDVLALLKRVATQRSIREEGRASVSKIINELVLANKDKLEAELK